MSLSVFYGAIILGLIYALMVLGVFLTFRILNFPDLTVDGSITLGAADVTNLPDYNRAKDIARIFQDPMMGTAG